MRITKIEHHNRIGKKLITPINSIEKIKHDSWANEGIPEYFWVMLLIYSNRVSALEFLRELGKALSFLPDKESIFELSFNALAKLSTKSWGIFEKMFLENSQMLRAVQPLFFFERFPQKERWKPLKQEISDEETITKLSMIIAEGFDHQSDLSSDTRWFRVYFLTVSNRMLFPDHLQGQKETILNYPANKTPDDVRGFIRASEKSINASGHSDFSSRWRENFWKEGFDKTPCLVDDSNEEFFLTTNELNFSGEDAQIIRNKIIEHYFSNIKTTAPDSKFETIFGLSLYSFNLLIELLSSGIEMFSSGRFVLRSLTEVLILLKYLETIDDPDKWTKFRNYGQGQTKLAYLKLEKSDSVPEFINLQLLSYISGEDKWQNLVDIDLGNWDQSNLRKMSEIAGIKDLYDKFYDWTSAYLHAHWGALRESVFQKCLNPMHRFHNIPRDQINLRNAAVDAAHLINRILAILDKHYPSIGIRLPTPTNNAV